MTEAQFIAWLKSSSSIRCVLIEADVRVSGVETTRYLSNKGYVTGAADIPANTVYQSIIEGGIRLSERISLDGSAGLSFGDIELNNDSGERDGWLDDVWKNRAIRIYIGDVAWARADFQLIFNGVVSDIDCRTRNRLNLKLRDKLQRLNTPVSEAKLGGSTENADRLIPLAFGECHNVEPLLADPATEEYRIHGGASEDVIEARDEGNPVAITKSTASGKFTLNQAATGMITASVQGDKPTTYSNTIAALVQRLVTGYGHATERFTIDDIDVDNFADFATENPQPVGLYLQDRANVLECVTRLAGSVGAQPVMTRAGLLKLVKIDLPAPGTPRAITADDMVERSLQLAERLDVVAAVKLGYARNWTVQTNLQTGIPAEHKDLYAQEWLTVTKTDATVATTYKLFAETEMQETLLLVKSDAEAEAQRRLDLLKVQRRIFRFEGFAHLLNMELGQSVTLTHERFGLSAGEDGMVVGLDRDWMAGRVAVGVLV